MLDKNGRFVRFEEERLDTMARGRNWIRRRSGEAAGSYRVAPKDRTKSFSVVSKLEQPPQHVQWGSNGAKRGQRLAKIQKPYKWITETFLIYFLDAAAWKLGGSGVPPPPTQPTHISCHDNSNLRMVCWNAPTQYFQFVFCGSCDH